MRQRVPNQNCCHAGTRGIAVGSPGSPRCFNNYVFIERKSTKTRKTTAAGTLIVLIALSKKKKTAKLTMPSPFPHKDTKSCQSGYSIL